MKRKSLTHLLLIVSLILSGQSFAAISSAPVTSEATDGAKKLYSFLLNNYGKKTISGVMTGEVTSTIDSQQDIQFIVSKTGKCPALVGVDFINATGSSASEAWAQTYTNSTVALAKEVWSKGGIPAYCWHWRVGTSDTYKTYDYTRAFKNGSTSEFDTSSDCYKTLINDMNKVADMLLQLQDAGVAVLWRPFHEGAGGWFWWGLYGAERYKALYRLMYNQFVNVKGVKNCIWVWNVERDCTLSNKTYGYQDLTATWYPGDEYVDIIGVDIYADAYDYGSQKNYYNKMKELFGDNKIFALTENGPMPDVDNMVNDNALWSYIMPWYETWNGKFLSQTSDAQWKKFMTDSHVYTLSDMTGWGTYVDTEAEACEQSAAKGIYEVECGTDSKASAVSVSHYSGKGVLNLENDDDYVSINISVEKKGAYKVYVGYNSIFGFKQIDCAVNGVSGTANLGQSSTDPEVDAKGETLVGTFDFKAGDNTVKLTPIWTWAVVDYVRIEADESATSYEFQTSDVDGFKVSGSKLLDRCGEEFVMRGVNLAYTWFKSSAYAQLEAIHKYGANAVRIVLTDGKDYGSAADDASSVKKLIEKCKEYGMVAILEVHDETGSDKISDLLDAANYFANLSSTLKGTESYVLINIANEWHNSSAATNWRDGYKEAIPVIRNAGLRHCIMVDAGGYGQSAATIHSYGKDVLAADPENNILFSIHMYGSAGNTNKVQSNIDGVINQDLALCIGEFGWFHSDGDVDEEKILSYCAAKNVGWLAWSWYGNGSPVEYLDLVKDATANPVLASYSNISISNWNNTMTYTASSDWGKLITDSWKKESKKANLIKCGSTDVNQQYIENHGVIAYFTDDGDKLHIISKECASVTVMDITGKTVYSGSVEKGDSAISSANWMNGLYLISMDQLTLKKITLKIVK